MQDGNTDSSKLKAAQAPAAWDSQQSAQLYGVNAWGAGYFSVSDAGEIQTSVEIGGTTVSVSLMEIVRGMQARGLQMPTVLRIRNILDHRLKVLNESFARAISEGGYSNVYRGVYPIKVNQQCHVVDEIARYGSRYNHGLEVGSKAELTIALSEQRNAEALIICNGYKDSEYIDLGLYARRMGLLCFFVLETTAELELVIERSRVLGIDPLLGARIKTSLEVDGHWSKDSGDRSIFGLSTTALMHVVDRLRAEGMLDCLRLLHCHLGSQIPNIRNVRNGVLEACRFYAGLVQEGAPMGYIDLGGGLAVDYEGAYTNSTHSMNYKLDEYCTAIVESIRETLDPLELAHPVIVSESGRATVAYSSVLLFNVLNVSPGLPDVSIEAPADDALDALHSLYAIIPGNTATKLQKSYNEALFYRDSVREMFHHGQATLRDRALAESLFLGLLRRIVDVLPELKRVPPELEQLREGHSDRYYGNFSLFQSLPDIWAIEQLFPIVPIHRLDEEPLRNATLADLTCDCDGKIDRFTTPDGPADSLRLHSLKPGEEYLLGVFLVGAYQETLGDLHNLFGDTNVVNVSIEADGSFEFLNEFHGDSIADVLSYVEYEPKQLTEKFRLVAEQAVRSGHIDIAQRQVILNAYRDSLQGYTYLEN